MGIYRFNNNKENRYYFNELKEGGNITLSIGWSILAALKDEILPKDKVMKVMKQMFISQLVNQLLSQYCKLHHIQLEEALKDYQFVMLH